MHFLQRVGKDRQDVIISHGDPRITWLKTVQNDVKSHNLTLVWYGIVGFNVPLDNLTAHT